MDSDDDVYNPIGFKLGVKIDTRSIRLYILILVYVTLTFIQGHRSARKQTVLCQ